MKPEIQEIERVYHENVTRWDNTVNSRLSVANTAIQMGIVALRLLIVIAKNTTPPSYKNSIAPEIEPQGSHD